MYQLPPYRVSNEDIQAYQRNQITTQQIGSKFTQPPTYLEPVAQFGQERMPLTQNQAQPSVIIYRVNRTALP
jgi:hypothetical protein